MFVQEQAAQHKDSEVATEHGSAGESPGADREEVTPSVEACHFRRVDAMRSLESQINEELKGTHGQTS